MMGRKKSKKNLLAASDIFSIVEGKNSE